MIPTSLAKDTDHGSGGRAAAMPGLASRLVAWQVLQAVAANAYADGALERELERTALSAADRALATELSYGAIRQRRLLDAWLDQLGKVPAERQPPKLRWLLHLGLYQLLASDRVPPSAAVSTSVELAKRHGLSRLAPVVNGLLRGFLRKRDAGEGLALLADPSTDAVTRLGVSQSLPPWLAALLLQWLPAEQAEAFGRACNRPPSLDLRVNRLRSTPEAVRAALADAGVSTAPIADLPWGLSVSGRSGDLRRLPGYAEGHWCVQDRAAQRIAPLLEPRPGERILDACAAPGGKSTHLAELMDDQGSVLALDRGEARLRRVSRNSERLGLQCIEPRHGDLLNLAATNPGLRGQFDRLLLDAPCSGLGTLARHADARWRLEPTAIAELSALQAALLDAALPLLKPGGRLVYATCTVHPGENQAVVDAFLQRQPAWQCVQQWQLWPGELAGAGDGFFAAVLQAPQGDTGGGGGATGGGGVGGTAGGGGGAAGETGTAGGASAAGPGAAPSAEPA